MPRLLLVDDNQSIHKIAETLLTATDIELTCVSSGAEALDKVATAGPYDVALLDTTMLGMDGWALLDRLRRDPATAMMPIAMMAGVLDVVDPETIRKAPIQGFLKKPVELRDLADRVRNLLATPVEPPAPEPEPEPEPAPNYATMPYFKLSDHPLPDASDLLILEASDLLEEAPVEELHFEEAPVEDLHFEEAPVEELHFEEAPVEAPAVEAHLEEVPAEAEPAPEAPAETMASLELEELDLEGLKGLGILPPSEPAAGPAPDEVVTVEEVSDVPDFSAEDTFQSHVLDLGVVTDELPDLGPSMDLPEDQLPGTEAHEPIALPPHLLEPAAFVAMPSDWSDESETLLAMTAETAEAPHPGPALDEHMDFGPDSFLDQEPGPEPTPAFLPELPEDITPVKLAELTVEDELLESPLSEELEPLPELDELPAPGPTPETILAAGRDTVPPWATTVNLVEEVKPEPAFAWAPVPEPPAPEPPPPAPEPPPPAPALQELPAAAAAPEAPAPAEPSADPLAALLADPVLMDRLTKAVVARLGDQIIREIAWEVMPEMADRLTRN